MNLIKDVVIVGGGTAGLIAALYLKTFFPNFKIKIVKSSNIGIIGVGEGTTEHWSSFMQDVGIDRLESIVETDATTKIGILFKDWNYKNHSYVHNIDYNDSLSIWSSLEIYNTSVLNNSPDPYCLSSSFKDVYLKNNVLLTSNFSDANQYHFDTFKLNTYLIKKCTERNISIIEATVKDINQNEKGNIISLITSNETLIKGDFFVDCSGFKRVLSTKLGAKWKSYQDYLPMNRAITTSTPLNIKNGIEPYTTTTALSSGWAWKIPTQSRYGNGYVFNDNYISSDQALNEFNKHLKTNIEEAAKDIKFEAGKIDKFWIKNCVSIGLSGGFSEPLEAQSIGFSIIQSQILIEHLKSYQIDYNTLDVIESYNKTLDLTFNQIIDFVQLHYFTQRKDSNFWKEKKFKITNFNKKTYNRFKYGNYLKSDFNFKADIFSPSSFYQVYYGLNILNKNTIKLNRSLSPNIQNPPWITDYKNQYFQKFNSISHVDFLKLVKENYSS